MLFCFCERSLIIVFYIEKFNWLIQILHWLYKLIWYINDTDDVLIYSVFFTGQGNLHYKLHANKVKIRQTKYLDVLVIAYI